MAPPSEAGRVQLNTAVMEPPLTAMMAGAVGRASVRGGADALLAGPVPALLVAATVKVHFPVPEIFTARLVVEASKVVGLVALPLRCGVTTYPVILLPFSAGFFQVTTAVPPRLPAAGRAGAAGFRAALAAGLLAVVAFAELVNTAGELLAALWG
ncbi:hypothetical protein OOJ91_23590 [Micromonospora lupini]|uniref:hypothetical protein n=1 Tax=Micromonospora lupini TaxID=285679 RepID=UPI00224EB4F3|nr:hypothetical protein [Micromonospora lupini]MCX5068830.1 hypothetical protein [Micromonospora lupini]